MSRKSNKAYYHFKLIEDELFQYQSTLKRFQFLRDEILQGSAAQSEAIGASRGIDVSKPTERKAIQLVSSPELLEVHHRLEAIKRAIDIIYSLPEQKKKELFELFFIKRKSETYIIDTINVRRSTFYKWKREIIFLVARELGWSINK